MVFRNLVKRLNRIQINYVFNNTYKIKHGTKCLYMQKQTYSTNENVKKIYEIPIENIRNFSIIAHVDHGKSTLADRLLEITGAIKRNSGKQVLDTLQVEKERGITVKAQTASLTYSYEGQNYLLNLIDTPGHVDFSSEVYRSLSACQGVILLVDANDGVQAQTVANFYLAIKRELVVIPVINKIDLPTADPERVKNQLKTLFDINEKDILKISAKLGTGVDELLQAVLKRLPPPLVDRNLPFRGLIFDSWYDKYKGAVSLIYVKDGTLSVGEHITSFTNKKSYEIKELALLRPEEELVKTLFAGEVGSIKCNMRSSKEAHIGDTLYRKGHPVESLGGFTAIKPMVFAGVYPIDQSHFFTLQNAIDKLILNDSAVEVVPSSSAALGRGWRAGFLGLLHMEVFIQRLEQEYGTEPIVTAPGVTYKAKVKGHKNIVRYKGDMIAFNNPVDYPDKQITVEYYEPMIIGTIITPDKYIGPVISLCLEKRGVEQYSQTIGNNRTLLKFLMPLNEVVLDFHDTLKTITSGYASFDYEDNGYHPSEIVKLNILLNSNIVEELSTIVHCTKAREVGKRMCSKLLDIIPRQLFEISIQATVGSKILARENLKAYRKDVTAKLYGGDVTRRMKLLAKQKQGKIKMRMIGNISLPRETFINVLKR
ncbi:translation factor GUF1 homolog, mitochondrial-like isoform X1 [Vespa mandarinia]|uniref:translation factor GUF1 homolog, mitochondrial-like isoform X1 n=1 Tax=Vespa mandarinia TaxID=7446 RepID=UPI001618AFD9|nr:translation factor GUF1 homolog, mitochondrial-like isoform X1 [Vespa mandarinia]